MNLVLAQSRIDLAYEAGLYTLEKAESKTLQLEEKDEVLDKQIEQQELLLTQFSFYEKEKEHLRKSAKNNTRDLGSLTRKEQRTLIDSIIDRIEVTRKEIPAKSEKQKSWERTMTIYFRFSPKIKSLDIPDVRTYRGRGAAKKGRLDNDKSSNGATGGTCSYLISITYEFIKVSCKKKNSRGTWKIGLRKLSF